MTGKQESRGDAKTNATRAQEERGERNDKSMEQRAQGSSRGVKGVKDAKAGRPTSESVKTSRLSGTRGFLQAGAHA